MKKSHRLAVALIFCFVPLVAVAGGYQLKPNEQALFYSLLKDELAVAGAGGESLLDYGIPVSVSAAEAAQTYEDNQVAGDQKYFNKRLLLTGTIAGINSGLGNVPYITMKAKNQFMPPQVHFDKPNIDRIVQLKKGQKVSFICTGGGAVAGTPMFKDCQFGEDYTAAKEVEYKDKAIRFLAGEKLASDDKGVKEISIMSIAFSRLLPEKSDCFANFDKPPCQKDLGVTSKDKAKLKEMYKVVSDELKALGVDVPEPEPEKK